MLKDMMHQVAVIGAAGKMGSGISLLMLQEMARQEAEQYGRMGEGNFRLWLIDANPLGLDALKPYLRSQLKKYAEKNITRLRGYFFENEALVSNEEIIEYFVSNGLDIAYFETDPSKASQAKMIFEAIVEDVTVKTDLFKSLKADASSDTIFLSNTSSIPIHVINEKAGLQNRLIGFHFYNPPAMQKLVELILPAGVDPSLPKLARELAKSLDKCVVESKDVAGFIGNGHFIREILYACSLVRDIARSRTLLEGIYMVNRVTQDFLIRPMGIFQLIDYVGIDVCASIFSIMSRYLPDELFEDPLIANMMEQDILGGQYSDGTQKNGFFSYKGSQRTGIYEPADKAYVPLDGEGWVKQCDTYLGHYPEGHYSWKAVQRLPNREEVLQIYFHNLQKTSTPGAELAKEFLAKSAEIAGRLVDTNVAASLQDVETVLKAGFFHVWMPQPLNARRS